jgi:Group II intron, maturase-specific domain/Reverse transcriptase (RNA-dependent DNA polymerase)
MPVERRGPAVCNGSNNKGGKGEMTKARINLQDLRRSLYIKAKAEASWRFWGLYVHVCKMETLREAYRMARSNDGAPGIDGVTFEAIEHGGVERFLEEIRAELVTNTYRPMRVRKKEIPKDGGTKVRVLSIPNIVLNELDQELERRGHRFTRYADDCNIYVRSRRAGERVMSSVTRLLTTKLKLRVNSAKSAVARPWERKFLGFSFTNHKQPKRRLAPKAVVRFKERVRELTRRTRGISLAQMIHDVAEYLRGWIGYFGRCETPEVLAKLEKWLRRRLRSMVWKQWKRGPTRYRELRKRGIAAQDAAQTVGSSDGPWHLANSPAVKLALPNAFFASLGLPELTAHG